MKINGRRSAFFAALAISSYATERNYGKIASGIRHKRRYCISSADTYTCLMIRVRIAFNVIRLEGDFACSSILP